MAGAIKKEHQAKILSETANLISLEDPAPGPGVHGKAREEACEEVLKEGGAEGKVCLKEQKGVQQVKACGWQVHIMCGHNECRICTVGETMQQFVE